jgi:hypothetical protein
LHGGRAPSARTSPSNVPLLGLRVTPRIAELLEFLGRHVIPRQSVRGPSARRRGAGGRGGKAMRTHLTRSLQRYRKLAEGILRVDPTPPGAKTIADTNRRHKEAR